MHRPFVYVNMAMTVDGKITSSSREYPTFTSSRDRLNMDRLRAYADAIVVGGGTLRADNPKLHVRDAQMLQLRRSLGKPDGLVNVAISASMRIDSESRFFRGPHATARIIATVEQAPVSASDALEGLAEVWRVGRNTVDLAAMLERLHQRGVQRVILEGGGELNWSFFSQGLVDELYVTVCPFLLGGRNAPTLMEGPGFAVNDRVHLQLLDAMPCDGEIFCRYGVTHATGVPPAGLEPLPNTPR